MLDADDPAYAAAGVRAAGLDERRRRPPTSSACTCRWSDSTRGLFDAARIASMKPGAVLDQHRARRHRRRSGAGRRAEERPPRRRGDRRVRRRAAARVAASSTAARTCVLTPHIAGVTAEANERVELPDRRQGAGGPGMRPSRSRRSPRWSSRVRWSAPARPATMADVDGARAGPRRSAGAGLARACAASRSTRRTCATAASTARPCRALRSARAGRCSSMRDDGLAVPGLRPGGRARRSRAARELGIAFAGVVQQPPLRRPRRSPAPGRRSGPGRPRASPTRRRRCRRPAAGIRSSAPIRSPRSFRAAARIAADDRPEPVARSRAAS